MIAAGYCTDRVIRIANGVAPAPPRDAVRRWLARQVIAEANPELSLADDAFLAVFTGRLDSAKGLMDLLTAWTTVTRKHPDSRLWLVGEGPEHAQLADRIESIGLVRRVVLAGSFDPLDDVLQAADCFVLPSYEEGLSLALLEAMAAGLPVVASDIPGNRLAIEPNVEGLLVPLGNPAALAAVLDRVMTQPALGRGQAARAGRQRFFAPADGR